MDCRKLEKTMEGYLHGDLTAKDRQTFEEHLADCPACREQVAEMHALETVLDRASEWRAEPPPFLSQRILANLPARQASGLWSWRTFHPYLAAASLILAIGIGFLARDLMVEEPVATVVRAQSIRIIFYSPEASSVALIGDFNEWGQREVTLAQSSDRGIWEFSLSLLPGVYHYNLLVDGEKWVANPKSSTLVPDGFGGYDSVLVVSEKCQDDCT